MRVIFATLAIELLYLLEGAVRGNGSPSRFFECASHAHHYGHTYHASLYSVTILRVRLRRACYLVITPLPSYHHLVIITPPTTGVPPRRYAHWPQSAAPLTPTLTPTPTLTRCASAALCTLAPECRAQLFAAGGGARLLHLCERLQARSLVITPSAPAAPVRAAAGALPSYHP
eukprot:scaffold12949_cov45-Phaeocystis_antarctica.AAC.2